MCCAVPSVLRVLGGGEGHGGAGRRLGAGDALLRLKYIIHGLCLHCNYPSAQRTYIHCSFPTCNVMLHSERAAQRKERRNNVRRSPRIIDDNIISEYPK